jgi:hypothetical protein
VKQIPVVVAGTAMGIALLLFYSLAAAVNWYGPYKEDPAAECSNCQPENQTEFHAEWRWFPLPDWVCVFRLSDGSVQTLRLSSTR